MSIATRWLQLIRVTLALGLCTAATAPTFAQCLGDCRGDGGVSVDELVVGINVALGTMDILECPAFDDGSGAVRVSDVVSAVLNALEGCAGPLPSWKQPRYAGTNDAYNPAEVVISVSNVAALTERWRAENIGAQVPVLAAGRLFAVDRERLSVMALSAADGREIWKHSVGCQPPPNEQFCTWFDRLVITPDHKITVEADTGGGGGLRRFDPRRGDWTDDGAVWFRRSVANLVVQGDDAFAFELRWGLGGAASIYFGRQLGAFSPSFSVGNAPTEAALVGDFAVIGVSDGGGSRLLSYDLDACPASQPGCGSSASVVLAAAPTTPVAFAGAKVALASIDGTLGVYEAATGLLLWSASLAGGLAHPPAIAHELIYQPDAAGVIHAFAAGGCGSRQCAPIASFDLAAPIAGQPVVAGGVLYAGTEEGTLLAFDALGCGEATCQPLWVVDTGGGGIAAGPIVAGGMLFATDDGGTLRAYALP